MRALGYVRVSTSDQAEHGHGLAAQHQQIVNHCLDRDIQLVDVERDEGLSAGHLDRPALKRALERIAGRDADALIVAKLDRLTRSVQDFAQLLAWFHDSPGALIVLDCEVDTTTPAGEAMASVMAVFAQFERRMISQRTKDGLAAARARGRQVGGPSVADRPELAGFIRDMRAEGRTLREICDVLNEDGIPTVRGGRLWRPGAIATVLGWERRPVRRSLVLPNARTKGKR